MQLGNQAMFDLSGLAQIVFPLGQLQLGLGLLDLCADGANPIQRRLLILPLGIQLTLLLLQIGQLAFDAFEPFLRSGILFLRQRGALNLELHDLAVELINRGRL